MKETYNNRVYQHMFITEIERINKVSPGKILHDGSVMYTIQCCALVINPVVNEVYTLPITHIHSMGSMHKVQSITIFVPLQYYNDYIPAVGDHQRVKIIGKRVDDTIVCVGEFI